MKRLFVVLLSILMIFSLTACKKEVSDSQRFKGDYEALNGQSYDDGKTYSSINIPANNKVKYVDNSAIIEALKNGTHVVYLGYPECPWCRRSVPILLETVNDYSGIYVYYYSIKEARKAYEKGLDNELAKQYKLIIETIELDDYDFSSLVDTDENGVMIWPASLVLFVKEGEIIGAHKRTVETHLDSYEPLDDSQINELKDIYRSYLDEMVRKADPGCNKC